VHPASGVTGLGGRVRGAVACVVGGWSRGGRIRSARGTSLAGVLVGAVGCHLPLPTHIHLPHFIAFVLTFVAIAVFFVALIVLLVVAMVVGLAFALLVVAVAAVAAAAAAALVVLVALVLAAVFALLFGPAWGYVRSALPCARRELGWGRWKETSSSRTRARRRCHANATLIQQTFCPVF